MRIMIYKYFLGSPTLTYGATAKRNKQKDSPSKQLQALDQAAASASLENIASILLVNKTIHQEAASLLYRSARMVACPQDILRMISCGGRTTRSQTTPWLAPDIRVRPEALIKSLTIRLAYKTPGTGKISQKGEALRIHELKTATIAVKKNFPSLQKLVVHAEHYRDIVGEGTIPRFVSPICCVRRGIDIKFVAQDVLDRRAAVSRGEQIKQASRLRVEEAVLSAMSEVVTHKQGGLSRSECLSGNGGCRYRGSEGGEQLLKDTLGHVLKDKYRVKVLALKQSGDMYV